MRISKDPDIQAFRQVMNGFLGAEHPHNDNKPNELAPRTMGICAAAKMIWMAFNDEIDRDLAEGRRLYPVKAMASKIANQVIRVAGVFALIENFQAEDVSEAIMERAISLGHYYLEEALRIEGYISVDPQMLLAEKVLSWLKRKRGEAFTLKEVCKNGPQQIRHKKDALAMLKILGEHNQILPSLTENGQVVEWVLNPKSKE